MKQEKTKKKVNGLLIFSICLLVVAVLTSLTFAYFTDYKRSTTEITFGKIEIDSGKTSVQTNLGYLLPGSPTLTDNVVVAKDVFSEDLILRARHAFSTESEVEGISDYVDILNGVTFQKKDAYGNLKYADNKWYSDDNYESQLYVCTRNEEYVEANVNDVQLYSDTEGTEYAGEGYLNEADGFYYQENTYENILYVLTPAEYDLATTDNATAGSTFYTDGEGTAFDGTAERKPDMANGFVFTTQAVNNLGQIFASVYNPITNTYTVTAVDADEDGDQDEVGTGYARNYQWFYNDGYFYLCNYFGATTDVDEDTNIDSNDTVIMANDTIRIKKIERTDASKVDEVILGENNFDLTTKAGRDALVAYFNETLEVTLNEGEENEISKNLAAFKSSLDDQKTYYTDALNAFNTNVTVYNDTWTDENLTLLQTTVAGSLTGENLTTYNKYNDALMAYLNNGRAMLVDGFRATLESLNDSDVNNYLYAADALINAKGDVISAYNAIYAGNGLKAKFDQALSDYIQARDLVAAEMADYQQLYVFALGGDDYNTIPEYLNQLTDYAQYGVDFSLGIDFEAVQSAHLRQSGESTDLDLAEATIEDLVEFFG